MIDYQLDFSYPTHFLTRIRGRRRGGEGGEGRGGAENDVSGYGWSTYADSDSQPLLQPVRSAAGHDVAPARSSHSSSHLRDCLCHRDLLASAKRRDCPWLNTYRLSMKAWGRAV